MFRYVAFVWDDADSAARERADVFAQRLALAEEAWLPAIDTKGLRVFCAGVRPGSSEPYFLHGGAGVVLGKLFERRAAGATSSNAPVALAERESRRIVETGGKQLIDRYWGRYVAFVHDEAARSTHVVVEPTATLPCFTARLAGVDVYFSRMEDVTRLGNHAFSVNWAYVAAMLRQTPTQIYPTGLNEVTRVLGGECIRHSDGRATRGFYWNALEIVKSGVIEDAAEAARALREVTRDCVHAWASSYRSIVHLLSGGLDSSIILACLKDAPVRPKMACLNYHSVGSNTDERGYAKLAAASAGCELIERERDSGLSLAPLLRVRRSAAPLDYFFFLDEGRCEAQLAREHGAGALFSGFGGDQIFYRSNASLGAGDFLMSHGVGPALFEVALDAARLDRISVWEVLGKAARVRWRGKDWTPRSEHKTRQQTVIRAEVTRDISRNSSLVHPALREPGRAPKGKIFHAYQMLAPAEFYNPLGSDTDPELVTPLISQPLLELAMRIPTWLLTRGGWDRAMARRAFEHDVPRPIVTRRSKGGQEEHAKAILMRNMKFARDLLLDGHLVREGIVARDQLAEVLMPGPGRLRSGNAEVYGCLSAEAWLRQWATT